MQKTVYSCDHCEKIFGDKPHISIRLSSNSGIAQPPSKKGNNYWKTAPDLQGHFLHFCNGVCIGRYFANLMKPTKKNEIRPTLRM